jgi:hypothetical protein
VGLILNLTVGLILSLTVGLILILLKTTVTLSGVEGSRSRREPESKGAGVND